MKKVLAIIFLAGLSLAQSTRPVSISWTASSSQGVTGYNVSRGTSSAGPFTQLNTALITGTQFTDSAATIGSTYTYQVVAVGQACTPTTPVGAACGSSAPASATSTIPAQPGGVVTLTIFIP